VLWHRHVGNLGEENMGWKKKISLPVLNIYTVNYQVLDEKLIQTI